MDKTNERPVGSAGSVRPEQVESRKMSLDEFAAAIDAETRALPVQNMTHLTLTDEEREAVEECITFAFPATHPTAATLRGLLDRTK